MGSNFRNLIPLSPIYALFLLEEEYKKLNDENDELCDKLDEKDFIIKDLEKEVQETKDVFDTLVNVDYEVEVKNKFIVKDSLLDSPIPMDVAECLPLMDFPIKKEVKTEEFNGDIVTNSRQMMPPLLKWRLRMRALPDWSLL